MDGPSVYNTYMYDDGYSSRETKSIFYALKRFNNNNNNNNTISYMIPSSVTVLYSFRYTFIIYQSSCDSTFSHGSKRMMRIIRHPSLIPSHETTVDRVCHESVLDLGELYILYILHILVLQ